MRKLKKIIQAATLFALVAAQLAFPIAKAPKEAQAAQNCSLNSFYGTVTYNGVATDGITVTLTDLTNAASALTNVTSGGGMYLIESANLTACAAPGDQIQISATYSGVTATQTVAYAAQALTNVNLALTAVVTPALTSIAVTPATASIAAGATSQLTANALDQNGAAMSPQPAITWTTSNPAVATVSAGGLVTGVSAGGPVIITAASGAVSGTASITVTAAVIPVLTSISVTPSAPQIIIGSTVQLTAAGLDQNGTALAAQPAFTFTSSNAGIASVSAAGLVTAVTSGSAIITASSGAITGTATVNVTATPVTPVLTAINVTPATASATAGGNQQFSAAALDQNGAPIAAALSWSSTNPGIASVNASGLATAVSAGSVTITASSGGVSGTASFTVTTVVPTPVLTSINVTPATASINAAATQQLTANALDQNGAAMNPQPVITWTSSNTAIASVDATGLVTGVSAGGPVIITATSGAVSGTASITVTAVVIPVLTTINVTPNTPAITVGGANVQLAANALDQNGAAMVPQPAFTWTSSDPMIAMVDAAGLVMPMAVGTAVITATSGAVSGTATVTVSTTPVTPVITTINFTPIAPSVIAGATSQLAASALDRNGAAMVPQPTFTWTSSNTAVATIDVNGLVTAVSAGTAVITATDAVSAVSGTVTITVTAAAAPVLTTINITPAAPSILTGATSQLTANGLDQNGTAMNPQPAFTWTSASPAVATVSATGLVTGVSAGTAVITAASGGVSGNTTVTITAIVPVLTTINVTPAAPSMAIGTTAQLAANGLDQSGAAMNPQPAFTWTSVSPAVATVSATGLVTGVSIGTAVITAVSGSVSGNVTVTITAAPPVLTSVNLTPAPVSVIVGGTIQFNATTLDQNGAAMTPAPSLTWTSANPLIGTINASGLFTAVGIGTTTVSATSGAITGTANITVASTSPLLTVLTISPGTTSLNVGGTQQFTAASTDQFSNPLFPSPALTWTSSDNGIGTISASGLFTAVAAGTVTITASGLASTTPVNATATITVAAPTPPAPSGGSGGGGGGGGHSSPAPTHVESVNVSLAVSPSQSGEAAYHFANGTGIEIQVPAGAVANTTIFSVFQGGLSDNNTPIDTAGAFLIGGQVFNISAMSGNSPVASFSKNLELNFTLLNIPDDQPNIGVFYFDPAQGAWILIPDFSYDASKSQFSVSVNHLTEFAVIRVPGLPAAVKAKPKTASGESSNGSTGGQVLGEKRFGEGSLLRGPDKKIYVISGGNKVRVASLAELKKYKGKKINNVSQSELDRYPTAKSVSAAAAGVKKFANGTLIKAKDKKIYVISGGKKVHVKSLSDLKTKYARKTIISVDEALFRSIP